MQVSSANDSLTSLELCLKSKLPLQFFQTSKIISQLARFVQIAQEQLPHTTIAQVINQQDHPTQPNSPIFLFIQKLTTTLHHIFFSGNFIKSGQDSQTLVSSLFELGYSVALFHSGSKNKFLNAHTQTVLSQIFSVFSFILSDSIFLSSLPEFHQKLQKFLNLVDFEMIYERMKKELYSDQIKSDLPLNSALVILFQADRFSHNQNLNIKSPFDSGKGNVLANDLIQSLENNSEKFSGNNYHFN